jgi:hypothetical protein
MTKNTAFLISLDNRTANAIVENIAQNYGISTEEALDEILAEDAEDILEYLRGSVRAATSVLLQKSVA